MDDLGPDGNAEHEQPATRPEAECDHDPAGTWVLQNEAAVQSGFSVSAVRKWRRLGLVADRKVATPNGFERVEVRLEDVLARAALQPNRRPAEETGSVDEGPIGSVTVSLRDLETLFERMVKAETRADRAETELQSARAQATYALGQVAELRRQLYAHAGQKFDTEREAASQRPAIGRSVPSAYAPASTGPHDTVEGTAGASSAPRIRRQQAPPTHTSDPASPSAYAPPRTVPRDRVARQDAAEVEGAPRRPRQSAAPRPVIAPASRLVDAPASPPVQIGGPRQPRSSSLAEAMSSLRAAYARLDGYRREQVITPARETQRQQDLADYDAALLTVCSLRGIPMGLTAGAPITVEDRGALTRALARAGLDVRCGETGAAPAAPRRAASRRRP